jgi:hypothetical protein
MGAACKIAKPDTFFMYSQNSIVPFKIALPVLYQLHSGFWDFCRAKPQWL